MSIVRASGNLCKYRRLNPRIYLFLIPVILLVALCDIHAFSQRQKSSAKGIVNFRFCCPEENSHCSAALLKKNSQLVFVDDDAIISLDDIAEAKVHAYYQVPRYDVQLDKDGSEITTVVYFNDFRVLLSFTDAGSKRINEIMSRNPKKQIAVFFDKELVMILSPPIPAIAGELEIAGDFTEKGAHSLVEDINRAIENNKKR
jgi:hypothetical protein